MSEKQRAMGRDLHPKSSSNLEDLDFGRDKGKVEGGGVGKGKIDNRSEGKWFSKRTRTKKVKQRRKVGVEETKPKPVKQVRKRR